MQFTTLLTTLVLSATLTSAAAAPQLDQITVSQYPSGAKATSFLSELASLTQVQLANPTLQSAAHIYSSVLNSLAEDSNPEITKPLPLPTNIEMAKSLYSFAVAYTTAVPSSLAKNVSDEVKSAYNAQVGLLNKYGSNDAGARVLPFAGVMLGAAFVGMLLL